MDNCALAEYYFKLATTEDKFLKTAVRFAEPFFQSTTKLTDPKLLNLGKQLAHAYQSGKDIGEFHEGRGKAIGALALNGIYTTKERDLICENQMRNTCFGLFSQNADQGFSLAKKSGYAP